MGWVSCWAGLLVGFSSSLCSIFAFLLDRANFGSKLCEWVGVLIPLLGIQPGCRRWNLQIPCSHSYASWLRLPALASGNLPDPRSQGIPRDFPLLLHPWQLQIYIHSPPSLDLFLCLSTLDPASPTSLTLYSSMQFPFSLSLLWLFCFLF
jgi:hypothetical protein